ncbi:ATP-dependent Clp protease adapter ClpS [filamentous cyanobacterium LEGE 07170]|nr:ATP-dependent Clp protease adapter ClpS [filamentous cyanobacterium LEGE 07170]
MVSTLKMKGKRYIFSFTALRVRSMQRIATRAMATAPTVAPEKAGQTIRKTYPNFKVIVLNDDVNTFQHVADCLMKYIPHMTHDLAWELTNQVHFDGQAVVWIGPKEQAELYHQQLRREGLTMAPLEAA